MTWYLIVRTLWPLAMLLYLCLSVTQLSERLKAKGCSVHDVRPDYATLVERGFAPAPTRANAMLGGACVLLAAFWGFDVMLSWWMRPDKVLGGHDEPVVQFVAPAAPSTSVIEEDDAKCGSRAAQGT